jgi:hypothetical protein
MPNKPTTTVYLRPDLTLMMVAGDVELEAKLSSYDAINMARTLLEYMLADVAEQSVRETAAAALQRAKAAPGGVN